MKGLVKHIERNSRALRGTNTPVTSASDAMSLVRGQFPAGRSLRLLCRASIELSPTKVALIQGSSQGLGLELVTQLLNETPWTTTYSKVFATCRKPEEALSLLDLQSRHKNLSLVRLDLESDESIDAAARTVQSSTSALHLLVNMSGLLHIPGQLAPETSLDKVSRDSLHKTFTVNAFGPILVTRAFQSLLAAGGRDTHHENPKNPHVEQEEEEPARVVNLGARVGSIGDNRLGGWYSYRSSKAALHQLTKCASLEFKRKKMNVACMVYHPGTCDTNLSAPFQRNVAPDKLFSKERAVRQLLDVTHGKLRTIKDTGTFYAWDGSQIPW